MLLVGILDFEYNVQSGMTDILESLRVRCNKIWSMEY